MKTFEEAFDVLNVKPDEGGNPDPLEMANADDAVRTMIASKLFINYAMQVVEVFRREGPDPMSCMMSIAATCFVAGVRVGQEMEKQS